MVLDKTHIVCIIVYTVSLIVMYYLLTRDVVEHYVVGDQISSETLNNLGSVFNGNEMTITNLNVTGKFNMIPTGVIVAWSGTTVPGGWALCNGSSGTPDLRGRFILGEGQGSGLTNRVKGQTGGEETNLLTVAEMPVHYHGISKIFEHGRSFKGDDASDHPLKQCCGKQGMATDNAGGGQRHNNMPPFYVLAYIMKL